MAELGKDEFEKLLEESLKSRDDFNPGDKIEGTIVLISSESSFLSISGKSEAVIDTAELKDKEGNLLYKKGDIITAYVVSVKRGEIKATMRLGSGEINPELLLLAYQNEMDIEGTVTGEVKGGYSVNISGFRCFCPYSQIDIKAGDDKTKYLNKNLKFRIIEYKENGKNIIVSRRVLLEESQKIRESELKESLKPGIIVDGKVASIRDFGIFVDLGGVEALVPRSEISWSRQNDSKEFKEGDSVKAKVLTTDWKSNRITLSLKQMTAEPWSNIGKYSEGQTLNGRVVNFIAQGAFVELEPGIEGFIHISRMSPTRNIRKPEEAVIKGEAVSVRITTIDKENRKIGLELITGEADPWTQTGDDLKNSSQTGIVENTKNNGISIRLGNGMLGFAPKGELQHQSDLSKHYPAGKEMKVSVKDIDTQNKKLILSETGAIKKEEETEYRDFMKGADSGAGSSLGNLFKDKFDNIKKQVNTK